MRLAGVAAIRLWLLERGGPASVPMLIAAVSLGALLYPLDLTDPELVGLRPLLMMVAVALCALAAGLPGGLLGGALGFVVESARHVPGFTASDWVGEAVQLTAYLLIGAVVGWTIDRHRRASTRLDEHKQFSLDLIVTANFDGFFTSVNPACTQVLGYSADELLTRPFLDFVHPDDVQATIAEAARQTEAGEPVIRFANRYRHKDGSYRWLEWSSRPDAKGRTLIAVARDITDRKRLEEAERHYTQRLEQAVKARTRELEQLNERLEEAQLEMLRRLSLAVEYRDDQTFEHTERVGNTAALLAEQLGLPKPQIELLRQAAPLHDIGKLAVPDSILLKPGKLTPAEFDEIKQHANNGGAILAKSSSAILQLAEEIARTHHEWWDGSGYPNGLRGDAIPISGRIVAVADVFDALTHDRPYKRAWTLDRALDEIARFSGSQFDPTIVDALRRLTPTDRTSSPAQHGRARPLPVVA